MTENIRKINDDFVCSLDPFASFPTKEICQEAVTKFKALYTSENGVSTKAGREEQECLNYSLSVSEDGLGFHFREQYRSAKGLLTHMQKSGPTIQAVLAMGKLDKFCVHASKADIAILKEKMPPLGQQFYTLEFGFQTVGGKLEEPDTAITILPWYKAKPGKMAELKALWKAQEAANKAEPGCIHWGLSFHEDGEQVFWRESYTNAEAVLAHKDNIDPLLKQCTEAGLWEPVAFQIEGPKDELAKMKDALKEIPATYYETQYGFRDGIPAPK